MSASPYKFNELAKCFYWWTRNGSILNAGDYFVPFLFHNMLLKLGRADVIKDLQIKLNGRRIFSIGSVIHFARNDDFVWGTGVNGKVSLDKLTFSRINVSAVRGPLTRNILLQKGIDCPLVFGDPALLASAIYPIEQLRKIHPKKNGICVVPHINEDFTRYKNIPHDIVSPNQAPIDFIAKLTSYEAVISSSLHGIVFADAYNIPNALLKNISGETQFKYDDYRLGSQRKPLKPLETIAEAIQALKMDAFDLADIQNSLMASLPIKSILSN